MAAVESTAPGRAPREAGRHAGTAAARVIRWLPVALAMAVVMLVGVLVVALLSREARQVPASGPPFVAGTLEDAPGILGENLLVLLLYAMGSVAASGIRSWRVGNAQPSTARTTLVSRLSTAMLLGLLLFVACRQAVFLGHGLAGFANYFYVPRWRLWLAVLPHAIPELTAVFLPVSAWRYASREGEEQKLAAFTAAAVLAALPLLAAAALIEVYVSPKAFRAVACIGEREGFRGGGDCGAQAHACPQLSPGEFERRFHIRLGHAEIASARRGCRTSPERH